MDLFQKPFTKFKNYDIFSITQKRMCDCYNLFYSFYLATQCIRKIYTAGNYYHYRGFRLKKQQFLKVLFT